MTVVVVMGHKNEQKTTRGGHHGRQEQPKKKSPSGPVSTSVRQLTAYITVRGIQSETSYQESDWPLFALKESMDNAYDFLNDYYSNESKEARKIAVSIKIESETGILRIAVRNSNINNVKVFENLAETFDYDKWYSSKRNQHRMTCGSLGDFLKRVLGMGYASWTSGDNPDSFIDKQWLEPLILRFNGQEVKVFIVVEDGLKVYADIKEPVPYEAALDFTATEVEIALPLKHYLPNPLQYELLFNRLENYYKKYKLSKLRTDFSFEEMWLVRGD
jgi:hypothetical protein